MKDSFERRRYVPTNFRGRISAVPSDPGYINYTNIIAGGYKIAVLLNGVEQEYCLTADPDEGAVHRLGAANQYGMRQYDVVKGEVTVRLERISQSEENAA
jgi:hypothetical protein